MKSLGFRSASENRTTSPSITTPVGARSIGGVFVSFTTMHLLHRLFQWRFVLHIRFSILGNISNGDSGSLEPFASGDDDEGDYGLGIFKKTAFRPRMDQRILKRRSDDDGFLVAFLPGLASFGNRNSRCLITGRHSLFSNLLAAPHSSAVASTSYFPPTLPITAPNL